MRLLAPVALVLSLAACGSEQDAARFERVEDRADIENPHTQTARPDQAAADPGYRHEAPLHGAQDQDVAPPAPESD